MYLLPHHSPFYRLRLQFSKMRHYVSWQTSADDRSNWLTLTVGFICTRHQGDTSRKTVISTVTGIRTTNLSYIWLSSLSAYLAISTHFQPINSPHNHYMTVTPFCVTYWMLKQLDLFQIHANNQLYALFYVFIYFISLHVSSTTVFIIGWSNCINTFTASYLNTQGLNNSCLKSPVSTLVDLTFQSRTLRSFSLNQLRNLSL